MKSAPQAKKFGGLCSRWANVAFERVIAPPGVRSGRCQAGPKWGSNSRETRLRLWEVTTPLPDPTRPQPQCQCQRVEIYQDQDHINPHQCIITPHPITGSVLLACSPSLSAYHGLGLRLICMWGDWTAGYTVQRAGSLTHLPAWCLSFVLASSSYQPRVPDKLSTSCAGGPARAGRRRGTTSCRSHAP